MGSSTARSGPGCGTGSGRGLFRRLAAGRFGPRALAAAGLFLVARRVLGLVSMPSMIADSGRVFNSWNRASLRRGAGGQQLTAWARREGPLYWGATGGWLRMALAEIKGSRPHLQAACSRVATSQYSPNSRRPSSPRRSPLALLLVVLFFSIACAWLGTKLEAAKEQRAAAVAIEGGGGRVYYGYQLYHWDRIVNPDAQPATPQWLRDLFGDDLFSNVVAAQIDDGATLACVERLPRLQVLYIHASDVADADLQHLEWCPDLRSLGVNSAVATDAGMKHLRMLTRLRWLNLDGTQITDAGPEELNTLVELERLEVRGTRVTDAGVRKFQRALPNCEVYRGGMGPVWK